jgi:hypothetical protein
MVSAMLTESDSSIALPVRDFKGLYDEMECKTISTAFWSAFRLDIARVRLIEPETS